MKQIVDKLNKIAKKINENVELSDRDLIIDSLDSITRAYGGTPSESNLIVDKLEDIAGVAHGGATEDVLLSKRTLASSYQQETEDYGTVIDGVGWNTEEYPNITVSYNDSDIAFSFSEDDMCYYPEGSSDIYNVVVTSDKVEIIFDTQYEGEYTLEIKSAGGGIVPEGTISITNNGTYDVYYAAFAEVSVQGTTPGFTRNITIHSDSAENNVYVLNQIMIASPNINTQTMPYSLDSNKNATILIPTPTDRGYAYLVIQAGSMGVFQSVTGASGGANIFGGNALIAVRPDDVVSFTVSD